MAGASAATPPPDRRRPAAPPLSAPAAAASVPQQAAAVADSPHGRQVAWAGELSAQAAHAAALFAVDPFGTGGVALRAAHGPRRDAWLDLLRTLLPAGTPWRRLPLHIADERLLGGLDLGATLHAGRPAVQRGILAEADGGVLLLAMAERLAVGTAARVAAAMDRGSVQVERDGIGARQDARFGAVALDEGIGADEGVPAALLDRLAFHVALDDACPSPVPGHRERDGADDRPRQPAENTAAGPSARGKPSIVLDAAPSSTADVRAARERLPGVTAGDDIVQALCAAALVLGVTSLRASQLALRTARAAAALGGRDAVDVDDAALAARLVLAPRATQLPSPATTADTGDTPDPSDAAADRNTAGDADTPAADVADAADSSAESPSPADPSAPSFGEPARAAPPHPDRAPRPDAALDDAVLDAAVAAIPAGLLAGLRLGPQPRATTSAASGRAGAARHGQLRGRPNGVRRGQPSGGARLNLLETLRAAAPWQPIRRLDDASTGAAGVTLVEPAVRVRRDDFRVTRFKQRSVTTTLFVVDASGSSALHRLAEAKGAVELLLADCYVRRDHVALLAFRGRAAELLLPPTRSLVRAKRSLAALPGGGGTPLAAGIDAAFSIADAVRRRGETPIVVLLTDGRANIARDGSPGRGRAGDDALAAARQFRGAGFTALLLDTSAQPQPSSAALAREMGAVYLPLPHAGSAGLSKAVRLASAGADARGRRAG